MPGWAFYIWRKPSNLKHFRSKRKNPKGAKKFSYFKSFSYLCSINNKVWTN